MGTLKRYQLIYADPCWLYNDRKLVRKDGKKPKAGPGAGNHYDCMAIEDIGAIPVWHMADDRSILMLWTTGPFLLDARRVIDAWQFKYKTVVACWTKVYPRKQTGFRGIGYYTASNAEFLLLATRGKSIAPAKKLLPSDLRTICFKPPKYKHSHKPSCALFLIELMYPELSKVELFSRGNPLGWDVWGLQACQSKDLTEIEAPWEQLTIFDFKEAV